MNYRNLKKAGSKLILALALVLSFSISSMQAQRIAVVDVNEILENLPAYKQAQAELDKTSARWRQEISQEYDKIKSLYNRYQAEQVLLSDEARKQKEEEIVAAEQKVRELQKQKFGPEGQLFEKRRELVQPIQEKVYTAIEDYANDRGYDFVFDKASASGLIFNKAEYDKTEDILKKLN